MTMLSVQFNDYPNCEENDGEIYFGGIFLIKEKEWERFCKRIQKLLKKKNREDITIAEFDCSNGGHGCILELEASHILNMITEPITESEVATLKKFSIGVEQVTTTSWYERCCDLLKKEEKE